MSPQLSENFLYLTSKKSVLTGELLELKECGQFKGNGFVIVPYQNPQTKAIDPKYYEVVSKKEFVVTELLEQKPVLLKSTYSKQEYLKKVGILKEQIQLGNIYEINFCMEFFAEGIALNPFAVFCKLQELAKAPYAALLKLGNDYVICASPELFLKKTGALIESKPIKGTARRGSTEKEDEEIKNNLYNSVKERTENVMAVDVARNDLSHFAERGSVKVNKLYNIETFETVHQMVSTVSCELREGIGFEEIMRDSFPMASMTGAPKRMAMTWIDKTEDFSRKYYSGAMGLVEENGDFTLSVIIRSIFYNMQTKRLSLAVGGAITYLSEPEKEYEECLLKASAMFKALNASV